MLLVLIFLYYLYISHRFLENYYQGIFLFNELLNNWLVILIAIVPNKVFFTNT